MFSRVQQGRGRGGCNWKTAKCLNATEDSFIKEKTERQAGYAPATMNR